MANFQSFQILADILAILQEVQKDPATIKNWSNEAHSLGLHGEAKVREAQALINQIADLTDTRDAKLAEFTEIENRLKASQESVDAKHAEAIAMLKRAEAKAAKDNADLERVKAEHAKVAADLIIKDDTISRKHRALEDKENIMAVREKALKEALEDLENKQASVKAQEQAIRDKAEKLRAHTAALLA